MEGDESGGRGKPRIEPGEATRLDRDGGEPEDEPFGLGLLDDIPAEPPSPERRGSGRSREAEPGARKGGENGGSEDDGGRGGPGTGRFSGHRSGEAEPERPSAGSPAVTGTEDTEAPAETPASPSERTGVPEDTEAPVEESTPRQPRAGRTPEDGEAPPGDSEPGGREERREGRRRRRRRRRGKGAGRVEEEGRSTPQADEEAREVRDADDSGEGEETDRAAAPDEGARRRSPVRKLSKLRPSSRRRPGRRRVHEEEENEVEEKEGEARDLPGRTEEPENGSEEESVAVRVEEPGPVEEAGGAEREPERRAADEAGPEAPRRRRRREEREGGPRRRRRRGERDDRRGAEPGRSRAPASRRILINAMDEEEIRIAVLGDNQLEELYFERAAEKKYLGNIYKGRVVNLEPGIQAAFVDLGIGRNGFLHVSDVLPVYKDAVKIPIENLSRRPSDWKKLRIQDILRRGQEVLVQISKDSIGGKGPSLTTYVSVPGKYLVLMPGVNRHGVSKRIQDSAERAELRDKLASLDPPEGIGYIVRTAGEDKSQDVLAKDFEYLMGVWDEIRRGVAELRVPSLIYAESDLVIRAMRDFFATEVDEILIDEPSVYERARRFLVEVMPEAAKRVKRYSGAAALFTRFGVEEAIERIYNRRVPLPSGGHLVIEQTEALVAIDVNSGKYRDEEDLEATALKTNLEAAEEIGRQLRLRDLGGVIIIDFIDMEVASNRREVERALRDALSEDRAKSWFTRISRFGIVEMTRQRVRPSFERSNYEPCQLCRGTGVVKSPRNIGIAILRQLRETLGSRRRRTCEVVAHPDVVAYLVNERRRRLLELESEFEKTILVRAEPDFSPEQYVVRYV